MLLQLLVIQAAAKQKPYLQQPFRMEIAGLKPGVCNVTDQSSVPFRSEGVLMLLVWAHKKDSATLNGI